MIFCAALVVPPDSDVYLPQKLAHRKVRLDYGNGTAYAGLQMLEDAVPREAIATCAAVTPPADRFAAMLRGEFDAMVLQEPWITAAEKAGCRPRLDHLLPRDVGRGPRPRSRVLRRVPARCHARHARINADKRRYVSYFQQDWAAADPAVQALTPDDFDLGRIQLRPPTPIPEDEARWAWYWMVSWGVLQGTFDVTTQINRKVDGEAHGLAFSSP